MIQFLEKYSSRYSAIAGTQGLASSEQARRVTDSSRLEGLQTGGERGGGDGRAEGSSATGDDEGKLHFHSRLTLRGLTTTSLKV